MNTFYQKMKAAFTSLGHTIKRWPYYTAAAVIVVVGLAVGLPLGLTSGCGGLPGDAAAKVGDRVIAADTLEDLLENVAAQYGVTEDLNPELYDQWRKLILEEFVATAIAVEMAPELGVAVTDEEVQAEIDAIKDYSFGGDEEAFNQALEEAGLTLEEVKYQEIIGPYSVDRVYNEITKDITSVSEEQIEAYYELNKDAFLTQEAVEARHILIAVGEDFERGTSDDTEYSDLDWAQALATAAQVRLELLDGGSWSQLAAMYSDDELTKDLGGDLGEVVPGDLEPDFGLAFENDLFALELDQISDLVLTVNGYHIIQVTKIIPPRVKTLEEARDESELGALEQAKSEAWLAWLDSVKLELGVIYREDLQPTTTTEADASIGEADSTTTTGP